MNLSLSLRLTTFVIISRLRSQCQMKSNHGADVFGETYRSWSSVIRLIPPAPSPRGLRASSVRREPSPSDFQPPICRSPAADLLRTSRAVPGSGPAQLDRTFAGNKSLSEGFFIREVSGNCTAAIQTLRRSVVHFNTHWREKCL